MNDATGRTTTPAGWLSPIEDVVREAERLAERDWDREHRPCLHDGDRLHVFGSRMAICAACRAEVVD